MNHHDTKVIAITGAGTGIGAATAQLLAAQGHRVLLAARRHHRIDEVAHRIRDSGGLALAVVTDVTKYEDMENLVQEAAREFGRLDVLVGNAGIAKTGLVAGRDVAGWSAMIDVNFRGVLHGIAAALPVFQKQGGGHFVTTLSTAGLKIVPSQSVYAATKNAVRTFLEAFRQENTDGTIRTTSISPGYVATELADSIEDEGLRAETQKFMAEFGLQPDAVAKAIAFAINQPADVEIGDITVRPTVQG